MSGAGRESSAVVGVAVVGAGYWGINHVRAFARVPGAELRAVCDPDERALERAARLAPAAKRRRTLEEVLGDTRIDAVVLATPAVDHAAQAEAALAAGKHVFVEKPLALTAAAAERVVEAARAARTTLMVGHLMLYHPGYTRLRELVRGGEIGEVYYLYSLLWSFAPHDLSMILDLVGGLPASVAARGESYLQPGVEDVVFLNLAFPSRKLAQVQLSWLDPRKERRLTVVGSKKMVEFDDVHPTEKLRIYDKGFDRPPEFTQYGEYLTVRHGDIHIPRVDMEEPLDLECRHFIACVATGAQPRTGAAQGLEVVQVLDAAQRSLRQQGKPVPVGGEQSAVDNSDRE